LQSYSTTVTFYGAKTYSHPSYIFSGVTTPQPIHDLRPLSLADIQCQVCCFLRYVGLEQATTTCLMFDTGTVLYI